MSLCCVGAVRTTDHAAEIRLGAAVLEGHGLPDAQSQQTGSQRIIIIIMAEMAVV